jgi:hypothetical protein
MSNSQELNYSHDNITIISPKKSTSAACIVAPPKTTEPLTKKEAATFDAKLDAIKRGSMAACIVSASNGCRLATSRCHRRRG